MACVVVLRDALPKQTSPRTCDVTAKQHEYAHCSRAPGPRYLTSWQYHAVGSGADNGPLYCLVRICERQFDHMGLMQEKMFTFVRLSGGNIESGLNILLLYIIVGKRSVRRMRSFQRLWLFFVSDEATKVRFVWSSGLRLPWTSKQQLQNITAQRTDRNQPRALGTNHYTQGDEACARTDSLYAVDAVYNNVIKPEALLVHKTEELWYNNDGSFQSLKLVTSVDRLGYGHIWQREYVGADVLKENNDSLDVFPYHLDRDWWQVGLAPSVHISELKICTTAKIFWKIREELSRYLPRPKWNPRIHISINTFWVKSVPPGPFHFVIDYEDAGYHIKVEENRREYVVRRSGDPVATTG
ncbi:hypothetical protein CC78DRAFT_585877 [Lojkania enalia]|uniref:Uncharacterized protein n=1 Tax=Lojkania enalia TaxID=147567 RepID=A0A9P4N5I9_9PLEO|nr:hypothetical protein CC78DRAFT_585877 [Didymosphaeria enalia]